MVVLWLGIACTAWLVASMLSLFTASDIAATPQPDQAAWVVFFDWLPAAPIAGALLGWLVALGVTRNRRSARLTASVTPLACPSGTCGTATAPTGSAGWTPMWTWRAPRGRSTSIRASSSSSVPSSSPASWRSTPRTTRSMRSTSRPRPRVSSGSTAEPDHLPVGVSQHRHLQR